MNSHTKKKLIAMVSFGDVSLPRNGYLIRTHMLASHLAKSNTVRLIQFAGKESAHDNDLPYNISTEIVGHEVDKKRDLIESTLGFNPFREVLFQVQSYTRLRRHIEYIKSADEVYIEGCLLFGSFLLARRHKCRIVLDTHCINEDVAVKLRKQNAVQGFVRQKVWHFIEGFMVRKSDRIIVVSESDRQFLIQNHSFDAPVDVVENQVKGSGKKLDSKRSAQLRKSLKGSKYSSLILFMGDLGAIQNRIAAKYIEDELAPELPDSIFLIIGANPEQLKSKDNVRYEGFVDNLDEYLDAADVCIAPLTTGSGTKTKVLDYMRLNKPIVSTPVGLEGIDSNSYMNVCETEINEFSNRLKGVINELKTIS